MTTRFPGIAGVSRRAPSKCSTAAPDHGAGLPGAHRLLASRRASFGPDGLAFVPARQSPAGKSTRRAGPRMTVNGPSLRFQLRSGLRFGRRADFARELDGAPVAPGGCCRRPAGACSNSGAIDSGGVARLHRVSRRFRCAALPGKPRAPSRWGSSADTRAGRCAPATCCTSASRSCPRAVRSAGLAAGASAISHDWRDRSSLWPAWRARFLYRRLHRSLLRNRLEGALQFQPHRSPADRPKPQVDAQGWRRCRPASIEHPRQRLCDRRDRFHGRHAGDSWSRRPQPRRLRLSRCHCRCRALEDRPASRGRHAFRVRSTERLEDAEAAILPRCARRLRRRSRSFAVISEPADRIACHATAGRRSATAPSGDRYLLIEYGEPVLDLNLRFRVQALLEWLER